jgi:hypothetical protein
MQRVVKGQIVRLKVDNKGRQAFEPMDQLTIQAGSIGLVLNTLGSFAGVGNTVDNWYGNIDQMRLEPLGMIIVRGRHAAIWFPNKKERTIKTHMEKAKDVRSAGFDVWYREQTKEQSDVSTD